MKEVALNWRVFAPFRISVRQQWRLWIRHNQSVRLLDLRNQNKEAAERQASAGARNGVKGKRNDLAARAPLHALVRRHCGYGVRRPVSLDWASTPNITARAFRKTRNREVLRGACVKGAPP